MSGTIWHVLGTAPTRDETAIRRAYAVALKQCRPEEDAEGFVRLRAAYEAALRGAAAAAGPAEVVVPPPAAAGTAPSGDPVERASAPEPPPPTIDQRAIALIRAGDVAAAADLLLTARDGHSLPLGPWMRISEILAMRLAQDRGLAEAEVAHIAAAFGWLEAAGGPASPAVTALRRRVGAARWLAGVRAEAGKLSRFFGNDRAAASALLLGKGWLGVNGFLLPYAALVPLLSGVAAHGDWAERALDAERLHRLRGLVMDDAAQKWRRGGAMVLVAVAFAAAGPLREAFLCVVLMWRMRVAWLRRFTLVALALAGVTALASWAGDPRYAAAANIAVTAMFAGYVLIAAMSLLKMVRQEKWRRLRPVALACAATAVQIAVAYYIWRDYAPLLRGYGLDDISGPILVILVTFGLRFVLRRASGGGGDSMPRW